MKKISSLILLVALIMASCNKEKDQIGSGSNTVQKNVLQITDKGVEAITFNDNINELSNFKNEVNGRDKSRLKSESSSGVNLDVSKSGSIYTFKGTFGALNQGCNWYLFHEYNDQIEYIYVGNTNTWPSAVSISLQNIAYGNYYYHVEFIESYSGNLIIANSNVWTYTAPAPTLNCTITGPTSVKYEQCGTWSANVSGGNGNYSTTWYYDISFDDGTLYSSSSTGSTFSHCFEAHELGIYLHARSTDGNLNGSVSTFVRHLGTKPVPQ